MRAILLDKTDDGVTAQVTDVDDARLPEGDVTVAVEYSTINYKDGLVLNGKGGLVKDYPHVPGIDFAGTVESSDHADFKPGDAVVLTGWQVGERRWGGMATKARVKGDWLVKLPDGLTAQQAMGVGTAGFTAMLAILALEEHGLTPERTKDAPVLVTGATGGVGSIACATLANAGYTVAAVTGSAEAAEYLKDMGVSEIVDRAEMAEPSSKPLEGQRWSGCVDAVGGVPLSRVLNQLHHSACVAAIGNAAGIKLETTVIPFLLRGVNLLGIDSVFCPIERRATAWKRLASDLPKTRLEEAMHVHPLADAVGLGGDILKGKVQGRAVIDVNA